MKKFLKINSFQFPILLLILLTISSCLGRPSGVLNHNQMVDVLTDMHKLEGTMSEKGILYSQDQQKQEYFNSVLLKHKLTRAEFDSSLVWYTKNPKQFELVYQDVIKQLTALDEAVTMRKFHPIDSIKLRHMAVNVWNKRRLYVYTHDSIRTKLNIEITNDSFLLGDVYVLKFQQRIAKEDSCRNPHIVFRIKYNKANSDSLFVPTHADGLTRTFTLRLKAKKSAQIKALSVTLLGSKEFKGKFNSTTKILGLTRQFNALKRDSLMRIVYKSDSIIAAKNQQHVMDSITDANKLFQKALRATTTIPK